MCTSHISDDWTPPVSPSDVLFMHTLSWLAAEDTMVLSPASSNSEASHGSNHVDIGGHDLSLDSLETTDTTTAEQPKSGPSSEQDDSLADENLLCGSTITLGSAQQGDLSRKRHVAIKKLVEELPGAKRALATEANFLSCLDHPNIVRFIRCFAAPGMWKATRRRQNQDTTGPQVRSSLVAGQIAAYRAITHVFAF